MRENCTSGSARGVPGNRHPYRRGDMTKQMTRAGLVRRRLFWFQYDIMGSTMGNNREYQEIVRLAAQGKLWPVVDQTFPLDDGARAFERLQNADHFGKVVIDISGTA